MDLMRIMPPHILIEFIFTIIIVSLNFLTYIKTKEIYDLTKYKGIKYFRNAFLCFGFAYLLRLFLHLFMIGIFVFHLHVPREFMFFFGLFGTASLSTLAILYLTYSSVWKKIKIRHFEIFALSFALVLSIISIVTNSLLLIIVIQFLLFIFILISSFTIGRKGFTHAKILYLLLFLFWMLNLVFIGPRNVYGFELAIGLQIISVIIYLFIYYRVQTLSK